MLPGFPILYLDKSLQHVASLLRDNMKNITSQLGGGNYFVGDYLVDTDDIRIMGPPHFHKTVHSYAKGSFSLFLIIHKFK